MAFIETEKINFLGKWESDFKLKNSNFKIALDYWENKIVANTSK